MRNVTGLGFALVMAFSGAACAVDIETEEGDVGASTDALTSKTFAAVADAEVSASQPSTALGKSTTLGSDGDPKRHSYLRFVVSGVSGTVKSAKVRCYVKNGSTNGPALYTTSSSWTETAITWNNKPATSGSALGDLGAVSVNQWIEFNVSSVVKGNGTFDFALVPTSTDSVECNSRESASNQPQLVISTEDLPPPPPPPPPSSKLSCPSGFANEVFRDDFDGAALDTAKWSVIQQNNGGGGAFTQLTKMISNNVAVSNGRLKLSSKRHCQDPWVTRTAPENAAKCAGANYYSGAWIKSNNSYAPGKGVMAFHAKMPSPVRGMFPALWARNVHSDKFYGELDLIETWWDATKGVAADPNVYYSTTHMTENAGHHTSNNAAGPFANLVTAFHVWEVEWDATATPATVKYYYRDAPGATRVLTRTVTSQTQGLAGFVSEADFKTTLADGWRPYVDFAVQPDSAWHVGPDTAAVYDPEDLEVESVIVCKP